MLTRFTRAGLTYLLVAFCWLFLVPVMASRIYRLVFSGIFSSLFSSRILQIVSLSSFGTDINLGFIVVTAFLCTFISLIWLRELVCFTRAFPGPQCNLLGGWGVVEEITLSMV